MSEVKTKVNEASVAKFLDIIPDDGQRSDSRVLLEFMQQLPRPSPRCGATASLLRHLSYVGKSGREGDWFVGGFFRRANRISLLHAGRLGKGRAAGEIGQALAGKGAYTSSGSTT